MTLQKNFSQNFDVGVKNADFDADFKFVEKVVNKLLQKSY
jgi:hypothetical protein